VGQVDRVPSLRAGLFLLSHVLQRLHPSGHLRDHEHQLSCQLGDDGQHHRADFQPIAAHPFRDVKTLAMAKVLGRQPSPRGLIVGLTNFATDIAALFATAQITTDLSEVPQSDWDILVTDDQVAVKAAEPHLYVVAFGVYFCGRSFASNSLTAVFFDDGALAQQMVVPEGLPDTIARLAEELGEQARSRGPHHRYVTQGHVTPFLWSAAGHKLAGAFSRGTNRAGDFWILPSFAEPVPWVRVAMAEWHNRDPVRFPVNTAWASAADWQTPNERLASERIAQLDRERERTLREIAARRDAEVRTLEQLSNAADSRERALLTTKGDDLKNVVAIALGDLGFDVQDMDAVWEEGNKREDLRVTDPSEPGWIALVEVRGYKRGAALNDLLRLGRFRKLYVMDANRDADASWYIANQFIGADPLTREPILASNPQELEGFADDGGVAMDTRELLRLWFAVESGTMLAAEARAALRNARGRFTSLDA